MPWTEAGKRLLGVIARDKATFMPEVWNEIIDAIEAEALSKADMASAFKVGYDTGRYDERERIRVAVKEHMPRLCTRSEVLAILDREDTDAG